MASRDSNWNSAFTTVVELPHVRINTWNATAEIAAAGLRADELGFLYRRTTEYLYCEGKYGGLFYGAISSSPHPAAHYPERSSVASAFVIVAIGLHMMANWEHDLGVVNVIAVLFSLNGISAVLAHSTGVTVWHNVDGKTMLLAVWLGFAELLTELLENGLLKEQRRSRSSRRLRLASAVVWSLCLGVYWYVPTRRRA